MDFFDISYLKTGSKSQQDAFEAVDKSGIISKLAGFDPVLAGSYPLDVQLKESDLDILCSYSGSDEFSCTIENLFGNKEGFRIEKKLVNGVESVIANFKDGGFDFELFGQEIPTQEQIAYRHLIIEFEILSLYTDDFKEEIRRLKLLGLSTEEAFAKLLNIEGDPYSGLLEYDIHAEFEKNKKIYLEEEKYKRYFPILTASVVAICAVLFLGINFAADKNNSATLGVWGYVDAYTMFSGKYWYLITTNFVHIDLTHIVFNLLAFWHLSKKLEYVRSKTFFVYLILSSALFCSVVQISFGAMGIGLSGVVYAVFGYLLVMSRTDERFKNFLPKRDIIIFIVWLFICVALTELGTLNVANGAHFGGMFWGMLVAFLSKFTLKLQVVVSSTLMVVMVSMIFWTPFSSDYLRYQAYSLHKQEKVEPAIEKYSEILRREPSDQWAKENLDILLRYKKLVLFNNLMRQKKHNNALHILLELEREFPQNPDVLNARHYFNAEVVQTY